MSWKEEIVHLAEPADGRVAPAFKPHHAAVALVMIGREQPLGRYDLCAAMSIGEGSARTLLKRLGEAGLITAEGRQGQRLTHAGQALFDAISKDIPRGFFLDLRKAVTHESAFANLVKGRADRVKDGIRQRDEAIIQGGYGMAGATTLIIKNGALLMPPDDFHMLREYQEEALLLMGSLRPEEKDVIVIGSADDERLAREVSMAAVLTLF
ncbi:MAG: DUF4443 domain-containing protein [Candidatus Thorarchaeota archaeon]|nr:DUF4443 domain-containing protein [Candidatus Thorarchaeota archaeon]